MLALLAANAAAREAERQREHAMLTGDPFDAVNQARIAEHIRATNVDAQYAHAMEHTPEVFASVSMLYIKATVNGREMCVFVDSGASCDGRRP